MPIVIGFPKTQLSLRGVIMKGSSKKEKTLIIVGSSLILIGVLCNARILGILFSPDGYIESVQRRMVILVFEAFFVLMGFLFIKDRIYIRGRKIIFSITTFILFLFVMEGCIRIFCLVENKIIPRASGFSKYLGWETGANVSLKRKSRAYGEIKYSTKKWGFRVFGNINSAKTKIFAIGDSITMGFCVSDGNTYYDYLKKNNNNIDLFAYGGAGYGTLQEYMILDKYFDIIKPDMVL